MLLVADAVGGVWDHSLLLARGLIGLTGARVLLIAAGPAPDASRSAAADAVPGLEWRALAGQLEWMDGGRDWLGVWRREVAALAAGWGADVVHVNQLGLAGVGDEPLLATMPRRPALVLGVHSDVVTWWRWVKGGGQQGAPLPEHLTWQRELAQQALRCADRVVCPSAFLARELAATYRLSGLPAVVHNAVGALPDSEAPAAGHPPAGERGLRGQAVVAGRVWDEAKNLALVAEALGLCRTPWEVEVAGELSAGARGAAAGRRLPPCRRGRGCATGATWTKDAWGRSSGGPASAWPPRCTSPSGWPRPRRPWPAAPSWPAISLPTARCGGRPRATSGGTAPGPWRPSSTGSTTTRRK